MNRKLQVVALFLSVFFLVPSAVSSVIAIGPGSLPVGSPTLTFTGLNAIEVNGLVVSGVLFNYSLGNGGVIIDGGPGMTNDIAPPNIVSIGPDNGILTITLPSLANNFGYGYAILSTSTVVNATTINLYNGSTAVGSLSYNGLPDPIFAGGFAGISSTLAFNRVQLAFNSAVAPAFALDNVTFTPLPEPSTLLLVGTGLCLVLISKFKSQGRGDVKE